MAALCALLQVCLLTSHAAAQSVNTYSNPVIPGDYPDPSIVRVKGDYWATTTSGNDAPHFPILHSRDLVNWKVVGAVFAQPPVWAARDFWAPELVEDRGRFFVYYVARKKGGPLCVAVATAPKPAGPYTDRGPLVCQQDGSIDPFVVRDEHGALYLVWKEDGNSREQPTPIWAQQLTEDGTKLKGKPTEILRNTEPWERHVVEGSFITRRGGWFYHFYSGNACCGRSCNYALGVARARKLLGPWEKNPANPILPANGVWQCPGHGSIVDAPDGRSFLLYHAYRRRADGMSIGREALLDEVKWDAKNGWPVINNGKGPSLTSLSPLGAPQILDDQSTIVDDFTEPRLDPAWHWSMSAEPEVRIEQPGGYLLLAPVAKGRADDFAGAVLTRSLGTGTFAATTLVDTRNQAAGGRAGLAVYDNPKRALGVAVGDGKIYVWRYEDKARGIIATADAPNSPAVYLRVTVSDARLYRFAFSANGRDWKEVGGTIDGSFVESTNVALTSGGAAGARAKFDWVRVEPAFSDSPRRRARP